MQLVRKIAENYELPYYTMSPTYSVCADHGYIAGEHFKCPVCGKEAEVYSRITGYYRPVKNWNTGKSEEFKERKTYDIAKSHLKHDGVIREESCTCCDEHKDAPVEVESNLLFTTKTCPNCKIVKQMLEKSGVDYEVVDAEEHPELATKFGIMQAPTMVVPGNGEAQVLVGVQNIRAFFAANK